MKVGRTLAILGDGTVHNHSPRCPFAGDCPGPALKLRGLAEQCCPLRLSVSLGEGCVARVG